MSFAIKNLYKKFQEKIIFDNFCYDFDENGLYVLVGKSGRGKTTLLRIIAGLDTNYSGYVTKKKASYAFQEYRLFPVLTALENVTKILWEAPTEEQILEAKSLLHTLDFSEADMALYPRALSGGMKQRVSLCRAILADRDILLLDEPFKELDDTLCKKLRTLLKKEAEHRLVILTTHNLEALVDLKKTVISID